MCGIAGIYAHRANASCIDRGELRSIRDHMTARGPDGHGEWFSDDSRVALGHRRLAIIELSERGAQPMCSSDGRLVITFNGEIYNYRELRKGLEARGCVFRSDSDTEVILQLYEEHGDAMLPQLRGMFAFALWDGRKQAMLLARDTFGIKPLYYSTDRGTLRFASQVKALLAGGQVDTAPQPAGHVGFFLWGSVPEPWTLYRGIKALPAGHFLWANANGAQEPQAFCRIRDILADAAADPARGSASEALDAIGAAVRDSIDAHHVSDVPVGIFLSSGLDSSLITALSASRGQAPRTLTLAFEEYAGTEADEVPMAEILAEQFGTRHATVTVRGADFHEQRDRLLAAMDQPSIDGINSWFVSQAAQSQGIKVALSGLGGDELFASYPSFTDVPRIRNITRAFGYAPAIGKLARRLSAPILSRVSSPKFAGLPEYGPTLAGAYLLRRGLYMPWEMPALLDEAIARQGWADLQCRAQLEGTAAGIPQDRLAVSALELSWYTRNQLLPDTDWASMAHSLEVRTPFLDVPLLRTIAPWLAAHPGITKSAVVASLAPQLPKALLEKPKTGFSVPVRDWLIGEEPGHAHRGLRGWATAVHGSFDAGKREAPVSGKRQRTLVALWSPEMATPGGIQSYMWRLWEMLDAARLPGPPPNGISLMDSCEALTRWHNPVTRKPVGAAQSKVRFTQYALGSPGGATTVIVGHLHQAPVALLARMLGNIDRYLVVLHGIEAWQRLSWLQRAALRAADAVVATTHYTARTCASVNALPLKNFKVIPLCADPRPAQPDPHFALKGEFPILFVARLAASEQYKGLETLMAAVMRLVQQGIPAKLHVIGEGNDRRRLEGAAQQMGLTSDIVFHGKVNDAELQAAYASAKVFAMPSAKEGFGIVFLEAMRHGVACVGGAHGGTPEVFTDGKEGYLVPYGEVGALAQRLERLATDESTRIMLSAAGKQRFDHDYSFDTFAAQWKSLVISGPAGERIGTNPKCSPTQKATTR
ncbi:MAG: asparagine synthase (glutamine-hydrolyzing) [Ramlibacter sp.]|nr:asparagine synthase (glutamine-hydrolyzing) [Ramlibacter sp.]